MNEQQTSNPYSPDTLNVHDKNLIFSREFGTNTTESVGDAFTTEGGQEVPARIDPREAMLIVSNLENQNPQGIEAPRGRSFLLPEWSTLPESPILEDERAMVIYAHLLFRQQSFDPGQSFVDFIMGTEDLIGASNSPFVTLSINGDQTTEPADVEVTTWQNGGNPDDTEDGETWGRDIYWRTIAISDGEKGTDFLISISDDGLAWTEFANFSMPNGGVLRRVGMSIRCFATGALDWVRAYSYQIEDAQSYLIPPPPQTGGRLFTP